MILLSLVLVVASAAALVWGVVTTSQVLVWGSLAAGLAAAALVVGSVLRRRERLALGPDAGVRDAPPSPPPADAAHADPAHWPWSEIPGGTTTIPGRSQYPPPPAPPPSAAGWTAPVPPGPPGPNAPPRPTGSDPHRIAPAPDRPGSEPAPPPGWDAPAPDRPDHEAAPAGGRDAAAPDRPGTEPVRPSEPGATATARPGSEAAPADTSGAAAEARLAGAMDPVAGEADRGRPDTSATVGPESARRPTGPAGPPPPTEPDDAEPPVEPVPVRDALRVAQLDDEVLVVDGHPRYHLAGCPTLAGADPVPLAVSVARRGGFTPCAVCSPDATLLTRSRDRRASPGTA